MLLKNYYLILLIKMNLNLKNLNTNMISSKFNYKSPPIKLETKFMIADSVKKDKISTPNNNKLIIKSQLSARNSNQYKNSNTQSNIKDKLNNLDNVKISHKNFGIIEGYSAITTEGLVRDYNEDRVTIIFNISKPTNCKDEFWPKCSFFGLYDGHGGSGCADFLRNNLHKYVL